MLGKSHSGIAGGSIEVAAVVGIVSAKHDDVVLVLLNVVSLGILHGFHEIAVGVGVVVGQGDGRDVHKVAAHRHALASGGICGRSVHPVFEIGRGGAVGRHIEHADLVGIAVGASGFPGAPGIGAGSLLRLPDDVFVGTARVCNALARTQRILKGEGPLEVLDQLLVRGYGHLARNLDVAFFKLKVIAVRLRRDASGAILRQRRLRRHRHQSERHHKGEQPGKDLRRQSLAFHFYPRRCI